MSTFTDDSNPVGESVQVANAEVMAIGITDTVSVINHADPGFCPRPTASSRPFGNSDDRLPDDLMPL